MDDSDFDKLVGKHITDKIVEEMDWYTRWPEIDNRGYITGHYHGDSIPDNATLVNWSSKNKQGHVIVVDGMNGFDAVLEQ